MVLGRSLARAHFTAFLIKKILQKLIQYFVRSIPYFRFRFYDPFQRQDIFMDSQWSLNTSEEEKEDALFWLVR